MTSTRTCAQERSRKYTPPYAGDLTPLDVLSPIYDPDFSFMPRLSAGNDGTLQIDYEDGIAVFIDGACTGSGSLQARAGMGIYFGQDSQYNLSQSLLTGSRTSNRAEICAAILALEKVHELVVNRKLTSKNVVIISDSAYVVQAITGLITVWKTNGWKTSGGSPVSNRSDFSRLDVLVEHFNKNLGMSVQFWLVPREFNTEADELAKKATEHLAPYEDLGCSYGSFKESAFNFEACA